MYIRVLRELGGGRGIDVEESKAVFTFVFLIISLRAVYVRVHTSKMSQDAKRVSVPEPLDRVSSP